MFGLIKSMCIIKLDKESEWYVKTKECLKILL